MASFPRWLDKARATGAKLISYEPDGVPASQRRRKRDAEYADIPPFLLPLSVRVRLDKDRRNTRSRAAPYDKTVVPHKLKHNDDHDRPRAHAHDKAKRKLKMPAVLKRLAGPPMCPIVVAQYKDEYRGVGHERELHWALVVITDRATLSGPSFQAYSQKRRVRRTSRSQHRSTFMNATGNGATNTWYGTLRPNENKTKNHAHENAHAHGDRDGSGSDADEYEIHWYTRCAPASLYDVSATVRTLCLGGVQVGAVRLADVGKLCEYLRSHPPVPAHGGWSSREYVLELLELLRPFKMLRADLQRIHLSARSGERREVALEDLLPDLTEVGRATQESIFREEFRPCVRYSS